MKPVIRTVPLILSILLTALYCTSVPRKEIAAAERAIQRAETVNAIKFAAGQYTEAKDLLNFAKAMVGSDNKRARVDAIKSKRLADRAYFEALQDMMDGNIRDARQANQEADAVNASFLSAEKYKEALRLLKEAEREREEHRKQVEQELTRDRKPGEVKQQ